MLAAKCYQQPGTLANHRSWTGLQGDRQLTRERSDLEVSTGRHWEAWEHYHPLKAESTVRRAAWPSGHTMHCTAAEQVRDTARLNPKPFAQDLERIHLLYICCLALENTAGSIELLSRGRAATGGRRTARWRPGSCSGRREKGERPTALRSTAAGPGRAGRSRRSPDSTPRGWGADPSTLKGRPPTCANACHHACRNPHHTQLQRYVIQAVIENGENI